MNKRRLNNNMQYQPKIYVSYFKVCTVQYWFDELAFQTLPNIMEPNTSTWMIRTGFNKAKVNYHIYNFPETRQSMKVYNWNTQPKYVATTIQGDVTDLLARTFSKSVLKTAPVLFLFGLRTCSLTWCSASWFESIIRMQLPGGGAGHLEALLTGEQQVHGCHLPKRGERTLWRSNGLRLSQVLDWKLHQNMW